MTTTVPVNDAPLCDGTCQRMLPEPSSSEKLPAQPPTTLGGGVGLGLGLGLVGETDEGDGVGGVLSPPQFRLARRRPRAARPPHTLRIATSNVAIPQRWRDDKIF